MYMYIVKATNVQYTLLVFQSKALFINPQFSQSIVNIPFMVPKSVLGMEQQ